MYYTVVGSQTIRPYSNYHVCVSTHDAKISCVIKVSIEGPSFNEEQQIEVLPNSSKSIYFKLPSKMKDDGYKLIAEGISGIEFKKEQPLYCNLNYKSIFIQTDKAIYKPGDLVRFRILVLDKNTRPAKFEDPINIKITDSSENHIKQFRNIELTKGVFSGELQLSQFTVLGNWIIEVASGDQKETKIFEIAKYVLPKFETIVEVPKHTLVMNNLRVKIKAKYTFGKPVKGEATVIIKLKENWGPESSRIKRFPLDGEADVEFDTTEFYFVADNRKILVMASVKDDLTGTVMKTSAITQLHTEMYKIECIDAPRKYVPNIPFKVTVAVKNFDDTPVQDSENHVELTLFKKEHWRKVEEKNSNPDEKQIIKQKLDENGIATVEFTIPEGIDEKYKNDIKECYLINANYFDLESCIAHFWKALDVEEYKEIYVDQLTLQVITKKLKPNEDVIVKVMSRDRLDYFIYQICTDEDILQTGRVDIPDELKEYELKIKPTFEMLPCSHLSVYFIKKGKFVLNYIDLDFGNQLANFIKIDTPEKAKPGEEIEISVTTSPDSYVGLLGIDQSVLLLKSGNDLSRNEVISKMKSHSYVSILTDYFVLSNANFPILREGIYKSSKHRKPSSKSTPSYETRKFFEEVWIWQLNDVKEGKLNIRKKVPDTITSWVLTGFSINPKTGLGLTEEPRKFKVFQPFFVSTNLPYSVKKGEVINIPVSVFNYLDKNLDAEVTLDNSQKEFEFAEATNDIDEVLTEEVKRTKRATIKANSGESVSFLIRPKRVGHITLKISAITPIAGDAVEQILLVEPEGVTQYKNKAVFIDLTKQNEHKQDIEIEIPDNIVPDSVYSEISVVGDLLGPTIENLDSLVRMPYGCGEQNMVNFVPNILVLKYLENLNKLTPAIEEKAKKYLEVGYQRELTYKHPDGSYSAFGTSDKKGSTWLTAYVARSFRQAAKYIMIDEKVIKKALEFLANVQNENGCFPEVGDLIDFKMVVDGKGIFLTAFTLMAFLENKEAFPEYDGTIKKGLNYLANNIDDKTNLYSLAVATYVLHLAGHEKKESILEKLKSRAISKDNVKYWSEEPSTTKKKDNWYWDEPPTSEIETTSYALMALLEGGSSGDETLPILKWLVSKRNSLGGYYSTQATVVGLQAVIKFSERIGSTEKGDIEITFTDDKDSKGNIIINDDNSLLLQTHVLSPDARSVSVTANGKGSTLAQISYRYNVNNVTEEPRFKLEAKVEDTKTPDILKMDVCTSFIPADNKKETNMVVMEVSLPTGYIADQDNLKALETIKNVKKIETKKGDTVVVIYFDSLDSNEICSPIEGLRTHKVAKQKPASIVIYDYYDNTRQARIFYSLPVFL